MMFSGWISNNYIELFGALAGVLYVILEVRQNLWLWPVGIITSAVYIWIFFNGKLYADMSLQGYYLVISFLGWYWWLKGRGLRARGPGPEVDNIADKDKTYNESAIEHSGTSNTLPVTRLLFRTGIILTVTFSVLFFVMWFVLGRFTDSPVPAGDSFITSLSIIATWMLARKIYEHWYLWIVVNSSSIVLFLIKGLYPTVILYVVYCAMSFVGLAAWKRSLPPTQPSPRGEGVSNSISPVGETRKGVN
jgi:nicotinamide mononucleotide transporter